MSSVFLAQMQEWPHSGCSVIDQGSCRGQITLNEPRVKGQVKAKRMEREGKGFHQSCFDFSWKSVGWKYPADGRVEGQALE